MPNKKKILIIEDEEAIADLEKDYLELSDFDVTIKADGESGLEEALGHDYDLIILDLMLPGLTVLKCASASGRRRTFRFSWFPPARMTSIKSAVSASARTII